MMQSFWVPGPLPGMNEIVAAAKSGRGRGNAYSRMKGEWTSTVAARALNRKLTPIVGRIDIHCTWVEPKRNRDPDNIHAGVKFILDGLVLAKVIGGDSQAFVGSIVHMPIEGLDPDGPTEPGVQVDLVYSI